MPQEHDIEVESVTVELMLEMAKAIQHLNSLEELAAPAPDGHHLGEFARAMRQLLCDPRRWVCAMDQAAQNPDWWKSNKAAFFDPELTHSQIAAQLNISRRAVTGYIKAVEIPADCYENLPKIN